MHRRNFSIPQTLTEKRLSPPLASAFVGISQSRWVLSFKESNEWSVVWDNLLGVGHILGAKRLISFTIIVLYA